MRLRDSYRDAPPFACDRSLALNLTAYLDLRRSSLHPMFCMPTLKYLAPPKIAVCALFARRRWGTPVVLSPRSTKDHSLFVPMCFGDDAAARQRPPFATWKSFFPACSLRQQHIRCPAKFEVEVHGKCTWKCEWEHACALWCFSSKFQEQESIFIIGSMQ